MRVLVTGHLGYLGTRLTPLLTAAGHEVVGADVNLYRHCDFGAAPLPDVPLLAGDIAGITSARQLAGIEAIVHLAGMPDDPAGALGRAMPFTAERLALHLAGVARAAGVQRFVACAGTSLYRPASGPVADEDWPLGAESATGRAAALMEWDLARLATPGFSPTCLRLPALYGSSPRLRLDLPLNHLLACAYVLGTVSLEDDGAAWQPTLHVEDAARAIGAVLSAPRKHVHGEAFNVGSSGENHRMAELAGLAAGAVPGARLRVGTGPGLALPGLRLNCDKIEAMLGFRPAWDLRHGAAEVVRSFRRQSLTVDDLASPRYRRLAFIGALLAGGAADRPGVFSHPSERPQTLVSG